MSKITELISNSEGFSFSYEVTPVITDDEIKNVEIPPNFFAVTWHAHEQDLKSFDVSFEPLKLAGKIKCAGHNVLLHISCSFMKKTYFNDLLKFLQEKEICNLFIIRGEKYDESTSDFRTTCELLTYIREQTGDYFCIGVAGFPGEDEKLPLLKEKVDSGANFILTQACFESTIYENFVYKCKGIGINIPILPGIFPFETEAGLKKCISLCKVKVSENVLKDIKKSSGVAITAKLILDLNRSLGIRHFHFFTMNKLELISKILRNFSEDE